VGAGFTGTVWQRIQALAAASIREIVMLGYWFGFVIIARNAESVGEYEMQRAPHIIFWKT